VSRKVQGGGDGDAPTSAKAAEILSYLDDSIVRVTVLRQKPAYRALLVAGTGLDSRITTMRVLRSVLALMASGTTPSIGEVAERLQLDQSSASRAIDVAVQQGYIQKHASPVDGRRIELVVTEEGSRILEDLGKVRAGVLADLLADWQSEDVRELARLLSALADSYEVLLATKQSSRP
jgi:DNA-binding MarR family transcriptional regulator